ncbi:retroviral-like aspartic protease family protein [Pelagerythrobacter sp.]|uniref:retroviral-like aspartic protease family protein n=1 Tax=Pelagerythrobacter sp. TaxID=2800702 RepID=UPI0035B19CD6
MSLLALAAGALIQMSSPEPTEPPVDSPVPAPAPIEPGSLIEQLVGAGGDTIESMTDYYERMTVPVTIGGEGPFRFMIDTGAQATVVTRGLSDRLALQPLGSATVVGMASRRQVELVKLDGLQFAARTFDDLHAPLLEAQHIGADGILGLDSLQDLRVLIDFRDGSISVDDAESLGGNRGYEIVVRAKRKLGRLIIADARIDGVRTSVVIDTGAQGNLGNLALQKRLRAKKLEQVSTTDVHGVELIGNLDFVESFRIDDFELRNLPIAFADGPAFAALGLDRRPALILGMRDLRLFDRVAIDFESRSVLFDLPGGVAHGSRMRGLRDPVRF